jgi:hypothetical protein
LSEKQAKHIIICSKTKYIYCRDKATSIKLNKTMQFIKWHLEKNRENIIFHAMKTGTKTYLIFKLSQKKKKKWQ